MISDPFFATFNLNYTIYLLLLLSWLIIDGFLCHLIEKYKITRPKTAVRERRKPAATAHTLHTFAHGKEPASSNSILPMQKHLKRFSRYSATTAAVYIMHDGQSSQKVGRRGPEKICKYLITTTTMCKRRTIKTFFTPRHRRAALFHLFLY